MISFNLSLYVQSPPVLEYRPRTDVRILKAMFEYFILESNKFKQKSFQYNQINSLSKVRITKPRQEHSTFATLWVPPYFLFPWHFLLIIKITFVKTPDNSLFSGLLKNREKRGQLVLPSQLWRLELFQRNKELKPNIGLSQYLRRIGT